MSKPTICPVFYFERIDDPQGLSGAIPKGGAYGGRPERPSSPARRDNRHRRPRSVAPNSPTTARCAVIMGPAIRVWFRHGVIP
jgi:hypothetical protein